MGTTGPGYTEVVYDARHDAPHCACGVDLRTLDGGAPAVSAFRDDVTGELSCSEVCAIEAVAAQRCVVPARKVA